MESNLMVRKSITMPPDMVERLEERARVERRSLSQIIRLLVEAGEKNRPYPAVPECPADCDREE